MDLNWFKKTLIYENNVRNHNKIIKCLLDKYF